MESNDLCVIEHKPLHLVADLGPVEIPSGVFVSTLPGPDSIDTGSSVIIHTITSSFGESHENEFERTEEGYQFSINEMLAFVAVRNLDDITRQRLDISMLQSSDAKKRLESLQDFIHKCNFCVSRFSTLDPLREHLKRHAKIECGHCSEKFYNLYERDWHLRKLHGDDPTYEKTLGSHHFCRCCGLGFLERKEVFRHLHKCHLEFIKKELSKQNPDELMGNVGSTNDAMAFQKPNFLCERCNVVVVGSDKIRQHRQLHGLPTVRKMPKEAKVYTCCTCGNTFENVDIYCAHIQEHALAAVKLTPGHIECIYCTRCFKSEANLMKHIKLKHVDKQAYECSACQATFIDPRLMRKHREEVHGVLPGFKCDFCGAIFESYKKRLKHVFDSHAADIEYKKRFCKACCILFGTQDEKLQHVRTVHPDAIYKQRQSLNTTL